MENSAKLVAEICKRRGIPIDRAHIKGHNEMPGCATACPGGLSVDWVVDRARQIATPTPPPAATAPPVPAPPKPAPAPAAPTPRPEQLSVDGMLGPKTISALQRTLGTPVDGVISRPSMMVRALQTFLNQRGANPLLVVDGMMGPKTISALQRYLGTPVDGVISTPSTMVRALQTRLNTGRL
jgi:peptidoglycan hydrolase-like protein with peptidoglycan-binding domain